VAQQLEEIENGALVRIKGRIKVERWYDGEETKSAIRIAAENVVVLCY
jgi:single-stranded DNA-binding protein